MCEMIDDLSDAERKEVHRMKKQNGHMLTIVLTILAALLSALGGILGNPATSTPLPPLAHPLD